MTTLSRSRTEVTVAEALGSLFPRGVPFRFTAYDGSGVGPEDAQVHVHLATPRGLSYLLTAPGDLGMVRAYLSGAACPNLARYPRLVQVLVPESGFELALMLGWRPRHRLGGSGAATPGIDPRVCCAGRHHRHRRSRGWRLR